ncbi:MAG: hypothetical protein NXI32_00015 [bacterium]|nr:hypothetical protein [bacterium]
MAAANRLYAAKGKKVIEIDLKKQTLSDEEVKKLMLGPTGNLRAPTLVVGKQLVVGFDPSTYEKVLN